MRIAILVLTLMVATTGSERAWALKSNDTMADWAAASEHERASILDAIEAESPIARHASRADVLACMNSAVGVSGHKALPIKALAEACLDPSRLGGQGQMGI